MKRENPILLQAFAWDLPADASHWRLLADNAELLADTGVTAAWLPPASKGQEGVEDVGYGVYDLYDLGEFDQCGSVPTKYGTKAEYLAAVRALQDAGVEVMADVVLNHRMGADATEQVRAVQVDPLDRCQIIGEPEEITAWTRFTFPGRGGTYSSFTWDWTCFKGTDWDEATHRSGIWLFEGKSWNQTVTHELGNYDYLMGADVHVTDPRVRAELDRWGKWFVEETGVSGLRLDAVKHIGADFMGSWLPRLREATGMELPAIGEFWSPFLDELEDYLRQTADSEGRPILSLFDVALQKRLHRVSCSDDRVRLCQVLDETLVSTYPEHAVTFVDNHDTQPRQSLEETVEPWFKPSAYALILLREAGVPCVFWGDLFGTPETGDLAAVPELPVLMLMRTLLAHGPQHDVFDSPDVIGFTREGDASHPHAGLAVLMSERKAASRDLYVGRGHAGETWVRIIGAQGGGREPARQTPASQPAAGATGQPEAGGEPGPTATAGAPLAAAAGAGTTSGPGPGAGADEPLETVAVSADGVLPAVVGDGGLSVYAPLAAMPRLERRWWKLVRKR